MTEAAAGEFSATSGALLIVLGGLPGSGKSTIARRLAVDLRATWLQIDTIEQALRDCGTLPAGVVTERYAVAYRLAEDNLRAGNTVIADSVNPLAVTRDAWITVAAKTGAPVLEVEIICSNAAEHQQRVESRTPEVAGLRLPTWADVQARHYEPWDRPRLIIDTSRVTVAGAVAAVLQGVRREA